MKKPTPTTILLTTLLTASVIGNAYQYQVAAPAEEKLRLNQPATDEPDDGKIFNPIRGEQGQEKTKWLTFATFALVYEVDAPSGQPSGSTVTIYHMDTAPTEMVQEKEPTKEDVFWAPPWRKFHNVKSYYVVEVNSVKRGGKKE